MGKFFRRSPPAPLLRFCDWVVPTEKDREAKLPIPERMGTNNLKKLVSSHVALVFHMCHYGGSTVRRKLEILTVPWLPVCVLSGFLAVSRASFIAHIAHMRRMTGKEANS